MFFLVVKGETLRNLYSLNSVASGLNLRTESAHKSVYQFTNLSLAFPTITEFSMKTQLMTGCSTEERLSSTQCVHSPRGRCPSGSTLGTGSWQRIQRLATLGVLSLLPTWLSHWGPPPTSQSLFQMFAQMFLCSSFFFFHSHLLRMNEIVLSVLYRCSVP